jgi:ABC-type transport system involved in multi-copper enzyme maturation permease subunit
MLWYKAWLETRSRFLISLVGMVALCSVFVLHGDRNVIDEVSADYYNFVFFEGHQILMMMWALAVTLIMMGGLLREKAAGSSAFTLALPVSRTRLMMVRICMGLAQAVVLAIVPWTAMFTVGSIFGKTHSLSQAAYYLVLLLGGGLVFFAMAVLISSLISGELEWGTQRLLPMRQELCSVNVGREGREVRVLASHLGIGLSGYKP